MQADKVLLISYGRLLQWLNYTDNIFGCFSTYCVMLQSKRLVSYFLASAKV